MKKLLVFILLIVIIQACRKDDKARQEIKEELIQSPWNLIEKSSSGQSENTWNEVWNFQNDGTFELYSEVASPYYSYSNWAIDSNSTKHIYIQYWGFYRHFEIINLNSTTCELTNDLYSNGAGTTYVLKR